MAKYQKPSPFIARVVNPVFGFLVRKVGLSPSGVGVLAVKGRKTGRMHSVPVTPMPFNGSHYLVSVRGESEWVRNIRSAGSGDLHIGKKMEKINVEEVSDEEKVALIREYLRTWVAAAAKYFDVKKDASDEELARIAPDHPVFRYTSDKTTL